MKYPTPDWKACWQGCEDGKKGRPNRAHLCSPAAREDYHRGYADGQEHLLANPPKQRKRKEEPVSAPKPKFPKGPQFTVNVTAAIMTHARERDSAHCMIAMAIRDVVPQMTSIAVDLQTIRFSDPEAGYRYSYLTPRIAQEALIDFDQGVMPEPFSFRLMGAHVTLMTHKRPGGATPRSMTEAQKVSLAKATLTLRGNRGGVVRGAGSGAQPLRVGGALPPMSRFARRREFGLKALKR